MRTWRRLNRAPNARIPSAFSRVATSNRLSRQGRSRGHLAATEALDDVADPPRAEIISARPSSLTSA